MKTIIVIDTQWIGHIPMYHATLVERLLALDHKVISISPKPQKAFAAVKNPLKNDRACFAAIEIPAPQTNQLKRALNWWTECATRVAMAVVTTGWEPDLVFFPGIENNIVSAKLSGPLLDKIFPFKWSGLYLTPKYLRKSFLKFQYKKLLRKDRFFRAKNCVAVAVLDENVVARLRPLVSPTPVIPMPDFTNGLTSPNGHSPLLDEITRKSQGKKIIGLVGELSKRKGLGTLIEIAKKAKAKNKDWFFIFCGPLNERNNNPEQLRIMKDKISEAPDNCFFHLQRIEEEEQFNDVLSHCDVIFAAYEKFYHSSNLLTKAACLAKPIIVSKGYCMEERVDQYKLGLAIRESDEDMGFKAIDALIKGQDLLGQSLIPQFSSYLAQHSLTRLDQFLEELTTKVESVTATKSLSLSSVTSLKGREA